MKNIEEKNKWQIEKSSSYKIKKTHQSIVVKHM